MRINGVTGFHEQKDESIVCKHRDVSVCRECLEACEDLVDVFGVVYFIPDPAERAELSAPLV